MELAALQLCARINTVTGSNWCHRRGRQLGGGARPCPFTTSHRQVTSSPPPGPPWLPLPGSQPHLSPPLHPGQPCPYVLPLGHQRRPGSRKMLLWAIVLLPRLRRFTSIARKWRLSMLPKIRKGMRLKGLFLTFSFTAAMFPSSSTLLILAYPQIKRDQNWASVLICVIHRFWKETSNSKSSFWTTEINFKVFP